MYEIILGLMGSFYRSEFPYHQVGNQNSYLETVLAVVAVWHLETTWVPPSFCLALCAISLGTTPLGSCGALRVDPGESREKSLEERVDYWVVMSAED